MPTWPPTPSPCRSSPPFGVYDRVSWKPAKLGEMYTIFCASPRSSTPEHTVFEVRPSAFVVLMKVETLAPHWFGEKAEKLPVPPGGTIQAFARASSSEPI